MTEEDKAFVQGGITALLISPLMQVITGARPTSQFIAAVVIAAVYLWRR